MKTTGNSASTGNGKSNSFSSSICKVNMVRNLKRTLFIAMIACICMAGEGCKSSKKAAEAKAKAEQEAKLAKEKEEMLKREEAERRKREEELKAKKEPAMKIESYFQQVASASTVEAANAKIQEALSLFASPKADVLIIIKKTGDIIDYDQPTTIEKYLNFLKDQKKTFNKVENIVYDANGKIKELTLITK